jgi:hypothetical protein
MDRILRNSRSLHNNRAFKQQVDRSYSRHVQELRSIKERPSSSCVRGRAASHSQASFFRQEQRISKENAVFVNKLAAV